MGTYYELLGITADADVKEITRAYRMRAKIAHPDAGGSAAAFEELSAAHRTLSDPALRGCYDRELEAASLGGSATDDLWARSFDPRYGAPDPRRSGPWAAPSSPGPARPFAPGASRTTSPTTRARVARARVTARDDAHDVLTLRRLLSGGAAVLGLALVVVLVIDAHLPEALFHPYVGERLAFGLSWTGPLSVGLSPSRIVEALLLLPFGALVALPWHVRAAWRPFGYFERASVLACIVSLFSTGEFWLTGARLLAVPAALALYVLVTACRRRPAAATSATRSHRASGLRSFSAQRGRPFAQRSASAQSR